MHMGQYIVDGNSAPALVGQAEGACIVSVELRRDEVLQLRRKTVHVGGRRGCRSGRQDDGDVTVPSKGILLYDGTLR